MWRRWWDYYHLPHIEGARDHYPHIPNQKTKNKTKLNLAAHFFGQRFWAKHPGQLRKQDTTDFSHLSYQNSITCGVTHPSWRSTPTGFRLSLNRRTPRICNYSRVHHLLRLRDQSPTYCTLKSISALSSLTKVHGWLPGPTLSRSITDLGWSMRTQQDHQVPTRLTFIGGHPFPPRLLGALPQECFNSRTKKSSMSNTMHPGPETPIDHYT